MAELGNLRRSMLCGCLGLLTALPAQAFRFEYGELFGDLRTRVSLGASWRTQDRSSDLIDKNNLDPTLCGTEVDDACISFNENASLNQKLVDAPGAFFGMNKDDGNLNYDRGDVVAAVSKLSSELSLTWGEWAFKAGGTVFFDPVNYRFDEFHPDTTYQPQFTRRNDSVARNVGLDATIGNLLVSRPFAIGEREFVATVGYQTIRWGESTLVALNSTRPRRRRCCRPTSAATSPST
jgi:hypothetical protein